MLNSFSAIQMPVLVSIMIHADLFFSIFYCVCICKGHSSPSCSIKRILTDLWMQYCVDALFDIGVIINRNDMYFGTRKGMEESVIFNVAGCYFFIR
jgi:hypothetical protein